MSVLSGPPGMTLDKLDALVPKTKLPAPEVSRVLEQVFEMCRTDWISDFLFTEEPIHMNHLTSSSLFNASFVSELSLTRVASPTSQPDPYSIYGESHHMHKQVLIVPTFTAGHITVGVGVMAQTANLLCFPGHLGQGPTSYYNYRFVRDASQSKLLAVLDMPKEACVAIYYSEHKSSTFCKSATLKFCRSSLLTSIQASKARLIQNATSSLRWVIEEIYHRQCPVCGAHHAADCGCPLSNMPPAHPFDFLRFKADMCQGFGTFEGLASRSFELASGIEVTQSFGARVSMRVLDDIALKHRLRAWSICGQLNALGEDPRQSFALTLDGVNNIERSSAPMETEGIMENLFSTSFFPNNLSGNVLEATSANLQSITGILAAPPDIHGNDLHSSFTAETPCTTPLDEIGTIQHTAPAGVRIGRQSGELDEWWNQFSSDTIPKMRDMREAKSRIQPGEFDSGTLLTSALTETAVNAAASATFWQRPPTTVNEIDSIELERKRRLEARKERNRASARRSNTKNKELRAAMRRELKKLNDKVEVLRELELQLRHENLALRKLWAEQKRLRKTPSIQ